jgi:nucleoside phosphorylase
MKLLILCSNIREAQGIIDWLQDGIPFDSALKSLFNQTPSSYYCGQKLEMEIELVITGNTMLDVAFQLGRILQCKKFHLVLQLGFCSAYDETLQLGDLVNVINDKPGDVGLLSDESLQDAYNSAMYNINDVPHVKGGFINFTNAYFNAFLPIRKVAAITVNTLNIDCLSIAFRQKQYNVHIETANGLGCTYACLYQKQPFYQLRAVSRVLYQALDDENKAIESLTIQTIELLQKIA